MLDHDQSAVDISVILTGYNEGSVLADNLQRVYDLLMMSRYSWEMILYDDGSQDDTPTIFQAFADQHDHVRSYAHTSNVGRGGTVMDAVKVAQGRFIGYIDTDLELSPVYIYEFVSALDRGADVVIATRFYAVNSKNLLRTIMSKCYIFLMNWLLGMRFKDTEAGFKFFRREKLKLVLDQIKDRRWFFDTEVVARSYWHGLTIAEVPVVYIKNPHKRSSVRIVYDTLEYAQKLWRFRRERHL